MSEKFPALDDEQINSANENIEDSDFLKREAEVLGDEFKTEQDDDLLNEDEAQNFEESYPAVSNDNIEDDEFSTLQSSTTTTTKTLESNGNLKSNPDADKVVSEWKERVGEQISKRDADLEKGKADLQEEAIKNIDEFYGTYNAKKQQQLDVTKKDAEDFLKKRDHFFSQDDTTTWDRALQLISQDDAAVVGGRDRTKFKDILQRLKGKASAPGA